MRALVLGGNRYIGRHLVFALAAAGHDVTVINSHPSPLPSGVRRWHADRRIPGALDEILRPHRDDFDIVYDNTAYQVADLEPVVEVFRGRVEQLVFTSSVAVYKRSWIQPVAEGFPRHDPDDPDPRKAYGVGKVRCEDYLSRQHAEHGLPATSLRVSHTLGPFSPLVTREPIFFARLEQGRPILVPGDGFPFVHLVHVADVARLMVAVAGNLRTVGQIYNVAGLEITSVLGCIRLMAQAAGVLPRVVHVPVEVARSARGPLVHWGEALLGGTIYAVQKAVTELGWRPELGLADGYRNSYEWFVREGRDLYEYDFTVDDEVLARLAT